jgi:Protein of unknown function (DUF2867)
MSTEDYSVTSVALPIESEVSRVYESMSLADAYSMSLPEGTSASPELLARFIFSQHAPWIAGLMKIRDALVAGFGLKTSAQLTSLGVDDRAKRVGIFKVYNTTEHEIVLGEDDKHLNFRLSVLCSAQPAIAGKRRLVVSTVVHCHNRLGRIYIFLIAPFHRLIVRSSLRRAARIGWPRAT